MPTRKICELDDFRPCRHPEHNPPTLVSLKPGLYEHECPSCGRRHQFLVPRTLLDGTVPGANAPADSSGSGPSLVAVALDESRRRRKKRGTP